MKIFNFRQTHRFNWYTILWVVALILAGNLYYQWHVDKNYIGIVEKRMHALGAQEPGIVGSLLVDVGEQVKKGQILATLDASDLALSLKHLQEEFNQIQKLTGAQKDHYAMVVQRLKLQTENEASALIDRMALIESKATELAGYNAEIERLKNAEAAGLGYSSTLPTLIIQRDALASYLEEQRKEADRLAQKLESIRQSRQLFEHVDDDSMTQGLFLEQVEYTEVVRQQILETEQRVRMRTVTSPCDGYVTDIFARPGDVVQDFDSLLVVEELSPRFLTVYIPETSTLEPALGMEVNVHSSRSRKNNTKGYIRFVHPGYTKAHRRLTFRGIDFWARKVRVELAEGNTLLPGEIVTVRIRNHVNPDHLYAMGLDENGVNPTWQSTLSVMSVSDSLMRQTRFEPSGLVWVPELNRYLIVSDDTGIKDKANEHAPYLFLMNINGVVDDEPVILHGIDQVNDLESITRVDNHTFYAVSSQNISKKDNRPKNREYLMKIHLADGQFFVESKINLLSLILNQMSLQERTELGLTVYEEDGKPVLNIEGATVYGGALYLGLKEPSAGRKAIIWKLNDVERLFRTQAIQSGQLTQFGTVALGGKKKPATISDLMFDSQGKLWALSTIANVDNDMQMGQLVRIDRFSNGQLTAKNMMNFPEIKPEGFCLQNGELMIVFDRDQDTPAFCVLDIKELI